VIASSYVIGTIVGLVVFILLCALDAEPPRRG